MTPAINVLKKEKVDYKLHEYIHNPQTKSYGLEAVNKMGVEESRVFKTLVVKVDNSLLVVAVIPVSSMLSMKLVAKSIGAKKASMADSLEVERSTGYILGGVSPLGQKKRVKTIIDSSAESFSTIYISAGRRGLEIELNPNDLKNLIGAKFVDISK